MRDAPVWTVDSSDFSTSNEAQKPAEQHPPLMLLPALVTRFLEAADELRWRLYGAPNPSLEFIDGSCRHSAEFGCSWRCPDRIGAAVQPTLEQTREHVRRRVGEAAFAFLDGHGEDAAHIDVTRLRERLQAIELRKASER